jgi:leucyl/phenylalanyl-tRNA---protein transferase
VDVVRITETLTPEQVLDAYRRGIFPMGYQDAPVISWHMPEERGILPLESFHVSRSLAHVLKQGKYRLSFDTAFEAVMRKCARPDDTWITESIIAVYKTLHQQGHAHSVEIWKDDELAGGTYGVHIGGAFFAESKFHTATNLSKVALAELVFRLRRQHFALLDVQYWTPHLSQFGVIGVSRNDYYWKLREALRLECTF